jgi:DNA-binding NtrC family response regulator
MPGPKRVLIVDDDPVVAACLTDLLEGDGGCVVEAAANGEDGVSAVLRQRPDLVLLDVTMPGIDGLEALKQIRAFDRSIPVIMVTGTGNLDVLGDSIKQGAFGYIPKPFNVDYVRHFVALALKCYRPNKAEASAAVS